MNPQRSPTQLDRARFRLLLAASALVTICVTTPSQARAGVLAAAAGAQSYGGDGVDRAWTGSGLLSLDISIGESSFTFGPIVELYGVTLPESGDVIVVVANMAFAFHPIDGTRSGLIDVALGLHGGPVYGNGGLDAALGAHARLALRLGPQMELFGRSAFTLIDLPYAGECSAVSPVAGCVWSLRTVSAQLGLGWRF